MTQVAEYIPTVQYWLAEVKWGAGGGGSILTFLYQKSKFLCYIIEYLSLCQV